MDRHWMEMEGRKEGQGCTITTGQGDDHLHSPAIMLCFLAYFSQHMYLFTRDFAFFPSERCFFDCRCAFAFFFRVLQFESSGFYD
jgi:hypothetical protein